MLAIKGKNLHRPQCSPEILSSFHLVCCICKVEYFRKSVNGMYYWYKYYRPKQHNCTCIYELWTLLHQFSLSTLQIYTHLLYVVICAVMKIRLYCIKTTHFVRLNLQHGSYWSRSNLLLIRPELINSRNSKGECKKKSDFILSFLKNTCTMICSACICEVCSLHQ